jgi:hypothetical protein
MSTAAAIAQLLEQNKTDLGVALVGRETELAAIKEKQSKGADLPALFVWSQQHKYARNRTLGRVRQYRAERICITLAIDNTDKDNLASDQKDELLEKIYTLLAGQRIGPNGIVLLPDEGELKDISAGIYYWHEYYRNDTDNQP